MNFFRKVFNKIREVTMSVLKGIRHATQWISELFYGALVRIESLVQIFYHRMTKLMGAVRSIVIRAIALVLTVIPTFLMFTKAAWKEYFQMWREFTLTPQRNLDEEIDNVLRVEFGAAA